MKRTRRVRTWVEIDRSAIAENVRTFRRIVGKGVALGGVIKSNAYGHNLYLYAKELERAGVDMLLVDSLIEGISLREAGIVVPITVLGYTLPELYAEAGKHGIALAISSFESLRALGRYRGRPLAIHVKVDTGMHRQGFQREDAPSLLRAISRLPSSVRIEGLFSHLAEAKRPEEGKSTREQIARFAWWKHEFSKRGKPLVAHLAATGGTLVYPECHEDMVRIGIGLYGVWPSQEVRKHRSDLRLRPVLSWRSIISELKDVEKGERVGYDFTETLSRRSRLAVVPIGYWHGYPRLLSGTAHVIVRGRRAKVVGRVSMDMIVVDVTGIPRTKVGDTVTLIGRDGKEEVTADEVAAHARTTAYEILTRLNPRMEHRLV